MELPGSEDAEPRFAERILKGVAGGTTAPDTLMNLLLGLPYTMGDLPKADLLACVAVCLNWKPEPAQGNDPLKIVSSRRDERNRAIGRGIGHTLSQGLLPRLSASDIPDETRNTLLRLEDLPHIPSLSATAYQMSLHWPEEPSRATRISRAAVASRDRDRAYPAYQALFRFPEDRVPGTGFRDELKALVIETCEPRAQPGLEEAVSAARRMPHADLVDAEEVERLSVAVRNVLQEYRYDQQNLSVPSLAVLPLVRKQTLGFMLALASHNAGLEDLRKELEDDPLPEVRSGALLGG